MTGVLIDTSVLIKWFHSEGEAEVDEARAILDAHARGDIDARVIDLALYELGNVLARSLGWAADDVADQLDAIVALVGPPLPLDAQMFRTAARMAVDHELSFYDASWAAAAGAFDLSLVSSDRRLIGSGLAESPSQAAERLRVI